MTTVGGEIVPSRHGLFADARAMRSQLVAPHSPPQRYSSPRFRSATHRRQTPESLGCHRAPHYTAWTAGDATGADAGGSRVLGSAAGVSSSESGTTRRERFSAPGGSGVVLSTAALVALAAASAVLASSSSAHNEQKSPATSTGFSHQMFAQADATVVMFAQADAATTVWPGGRRSSDAQQGSGGIGLVRSARRAGIDGVTFALSRSSAIISRSSRSRLYASSSSLTACDSCTVKTARRCFARRTCSDRTVGFQLSERALAAAISASCSPTPMENKQWMPASKPSLRGPIPCVAAKLVSSRMRRAKLHWHSSAKEKASKRFWASAV